MSFQNKLLHIIEKNQSILCIGLDTHADRIPEHLKNRENPLYDFNKAIIDKTVQYAAAYKLNTAFYEACGIMGWEALKKTVQYIPDSVLTIVDAKRGDIGNTSKLYAQALFNELNADAITVNPLMGYDSVYPFIENPEKGVFFLCLTSNPGTKDFQHFNDGTQTLYSKIALTVKTWNEKQNCGLVVGATHPYELNTIREWVPELPLLIPGIGAQGGDLEKSVINGTDKRGSNALFNSSRSIIFASNGTDFAEKAAQKAKETSMALNDARKDKIVNR